MNGYHGDMYVHIHFTPNTLIPGTGARTEPCQPAHMYTILAGEVSGGSATRTLGLTSRDYQYSTNPESHISGVFSS